MSQDPGARAAQRLLDMQARGASHYEAKGCLRKVTYQSRKGARQAAAQLHESGRSKLSPYRCPHCELFHLTTENKRAKGAA